MEAVGGGEGCFTEEKMDLDSFGNSKIYINSARSSPRNTLSTKTLQGELPLGKHWYFSSSRSRQTQALQSPGVRALINQVISASVSLFIEFYLTLHQLSFFGVEYSFLRKKSNLFLHFTIVIKFLDKPFF